MNEKEAIDVCEGWFKYLDRQREKSLELQRAARLAKEGNIVEAQRIKRTIDNNLLVYDTAKLEPAVKFLYKKLLDKYGTLDE